MIQIMMSSWTTIKIEPLSGKSTWELKQRYNFGMADLAHIQEDSFTGKV
jgi:hypothetical protein